MYIKDFNLHNFRGINNLTLDFDDYINLLVGENGVGKSSVLMSIGIMLSVFINRVKGTASHTKKFTLDDITDGETIMSSSIRLCLSGETLKWSTTFSNPINEFRKSYNSELGELNSFLKPLSQRLNNE